MVVLLKGDLVRWNGIREERSLHTEAALDFATRLRKEDTESSSNPRPSTEAGGDGEGSVKNDDGGGRLEEVGEGTLTIGRKDDSVIVVALLEGDAG